MAFWRRGAGNVDVLGGGALRQVERLCRSFYGLDDVGSAEAHGNAARGQRAETERRSIASLNSFAPMLGRDCDNDWSVTRF